VAASWAAAARTSYWLDTPHRPAPRAALSGSVSTDLAVIGAGYTGLWTALRAKDRDPARDVLLIDAERIGGAASGRNGGFCAASLTHGESNGRTRFPDEYEQLHRLGLQNLDDIEKAVQHHAIDCDFRRTGDLLVPTEPYQVEGLRAAGGEFLDTTAVRRELNSPIYLAGRWDRTGVALVDPARLAWGLADVVERLGVRITEHTPALDLRRDGETIVVRTGSGTVRARQVALATNAYQPSASQPPRDTLKSPRTRSSRRLPAPSQVLLDPLCEHQGPALRTGRHRHVSTVGRDQRRIGARRGRGRLCHFPSSRSAARQPSSTAARHGSPPRKAIKGREWR
jgi:glycine/D-amino acid oxidase-like deaminating enzyme